MLMVERLLSRVGLPGGERQRMLGIGSVEGGCMAFCLRESQVTTNTGSGARNYDFGRSAKRTGMP
jgi:hypothetical protein